MRAHFLQYIFLFLLVHNSEFLENLIKKILYQTTFWCGLVLNGIKKHFSNSLWMGTIAICYKEMGRCLWIVCMVSIYAVKSKRHCSVVSFLVHAYLCACSMLFLRRVPSHWKRNWQSVNQHSWDPWQYHVITGCLL